MHCRLPRSGSLARAWLAGTTSSLMSHKILVIGPSHQGALPESYARAFERLGMEVVRFDSEVAMMQAGRFTGNRVLRRAFRPLLWRELNRAVLETAKTVRPALIFAVRD